MTPIPCGRGTDLDLALQDADTVINCAGPFAVTATPTIESAIRRGSLISTSPPSSRS